jgi:hypothetical protein
MIIIRFPDEQTELRGLGFLAKRFPLTTWATGETLVPPAALPALALEGISFTVKGRTTYEQNATAVRGAPAGAVQ